MRNTLKLALAALLLSAVFSTAATAGWDEGVAAFKAGNLAQAATEFKAIADSQPEWPGGHYMLGWTYLKQDKHQEAIAHLRKAYELDSSNPGYQIRLGEAYVAAGRFRDAVAFLGKIDAGSLPKDQQSFLAQLKAVAYTKTGEDNRALNEFAKAAQANPNDAKLQYQYGTAAYNSGDTATAVRVLDKAASLDPRDPEKQSALVKALNRQGRESRGNAKLTAYRSAAQAANKLVALSGSFDNLMLLGEAHLGAKQYDPAIDAFQKAADKNSGDWLAHYYIGQAYTAKQQYRSAESSLKVAIDKTRAAADQAKIWKQLGFVYEKQKAYDTAISAYQKAGDTGAVARVTENKKTAEYNKSVEEEAEQIRRLQEEQEKIRKELQELPGGPPPA